MTAIICPFLGRADDRETAFAFGSPGNRCYKTDNPVSIALSHQNTYCLGDNYTQCPVFLSKSQESVDGVISEFQSTSIVGINHPSEGDTPQKSFSKNNPLINWASTFYTGFSTRFNQLVNTGPAPNPALPAIVLTCLAILIVAILFLSVITISTLSSRRPTQASAAINTTPSGDMQPEIFLITLTPTFRSAFATKIGNTGIQTGILLEPLDTSTPMPTPLTIVVTPTNAPAAPAFHACGAPASWVPYIVQEGDYLTLLSQIYDVPLFELSSNNCLGVTDNLYIGQQIYVPFDLQ